jgi:predicted AlkP superfamily phosphohydrolase/phosphomutase
MQESGPKVVVFGIDGATFDVIDPLIAAGRLPHLEALMREGTRAPLKSTIMPNSYPAWTSAVTGVNPGKHSIYWALIRKNDTSFPLKLMNSQDIKARTLWEILGEKGYRAGVVNLPTEYPPRKIDGFLVCGALTPGPESDYTYPRSLKQEILSVVPGYRCEIDFARSSLKELAGQIMLSVENREKLLFHLMKNKEWDLLFCVFTETDLTQHKFWAGMDRQHPDHARYKKYLDFVHQVYQRMDQALGTLREQLPPDTTLFVVSDHGFGPFYQSFSVPQWLIDQGYLVLKQDLSRNVLGGLLKNAAWKKRARRLMAALADRLPLDEKRRDVRALREKDERSSAQLTQRIDWNLTRAYYTSDYGIRLNLAGREPDGLVSPGEEEKDLKEELKSKLSRLAFSNGEPVFEAVQNREDAYSGKYLDRAADLVVPVNHAQAPARPEKWKYTQTHPSLCGTHSPWGILISTGPGIKKNCALKHAGIMDLTPTVLHIFGVSDIKGLDGNVLFELFESS